jgi:CrcB protein
VTTAWTGAAAVLVGGATGALARTALAEALPQRGLSWPWATFLANVAGAALLAWVVTRLHGTPRAPHWRLLLGTGFCGALTTFSTFQIETLRLARDGAPGLALAYVLATIAAGLLVTVAVMVAVRRHRPA